MIRQYNSYLLGETRRMEFEHTLPKNNINLHLIGLKLFLMLFLLSFVDVLFRKMILLRDEESLCKNKTIIRNHTLHLFALEKSKKVYFQKLLIFLQENDPFLIPVCLDKIQIILLKLFVLRVQVMD